MCTLIDNVAEYLEGLGFSRDDTVLPDGVQDHMSYSHFNGHTILIDDHGQGWSAGGTINPGTQFRLQQVQIIE